MTAQSNATPGADAKSTLVQAFREFFKRKLGAISIDTRIFAEIMNDPQVPLPARGIAAGVLVYLSTVRDIIRDKLKIIGLIDDVIVMTIGLAICIDMMPVRHRAHYERKYDAVTKVHEDTDFLKGILGIVWNRLWSYVENLTSSKYRSHSMEEVVESDELREALYDDTMEYLAKSAVDPAVLDKEIARLPAPEKVVGLLTSGVEELDPSAEQSKGAVGWSRLNHVFRKQNDDPPG